jgi:hypothetical protein
MTRSNRRASLIAALLLLLVAACSARPSPTANPPTPAGVTQAPARITATSPVSPPALVETQAFPLPEAGRSSAIDLGEEQVTLWAAEVIASSNAGETAYHASQALGRPDTLLCGDFVTAWRPAAAARQAWIELSFFPPLLPTAISIAQSAHPGQINRIELITLDDEVLTVFDAAQEEVSLSTDCPGSAYFSLPQVDSLVGALRITLERGADEAWTQIDAAGVTGWLSDEPLQAEPTPAWVDQDEPEDIFTPRHFSNGNRIQALLFAGDTLWAGGAGGLVAWDLSDRSAPAYVKTGAFDVQALASCDFAELGGDQPMLVAGGAQGVFTLSPPAYWEDGPTFQPLVHPGDQDFGRVTALGCDNDNRLLWVGYTGHLSRYDPADQTWLEVTVEDGLPADTVRQVKIFDGDAWVATAAGVVVLRDGALINSYTPDNSGIPSGFIHATGIDEAMNMWMASSDGLVSFDGLAWKLWPVDEIEGGSLSQVLISLRMADDGALWLADTFGTACRFIPGWNQCREIIQPPESFAALEAFEIDPGGRLAIGSQDDGVWLYDQGEWRALRTRDPIGSNALRALAATPNGELWLAGEQGLQHFSAAQPAAPWIDEPLPGEARPFSFYVASDGLWIGHTGGARFIPYLDSAERLDIPMTGGGAGVDNTVTAIGRDAELRVYFGLSAGLRTWDGANLRLVDLSGGSAQLPQPRVNAIYASGLESWVGTSRGLFRFVRGEQVDRWVEALQSASSYGSASVGALLPSPLGDGLLVSIGRELFLFDGQERFQKVLELPAEITSLYAGPYQLWLATASAGLYSVPVDDSPAVYWEIAARDLNLPDHFGYQALAMSDAYTLWLASSANGLTRLSGMWGQ